jgi:hypothetical protein
MQLMSKTIQFIPEKGRLLLRYQPSDSRDPLYVSRELSTAGKAMIRKTFAFESADLVEKIVPDEADEGECTFVFGIAEEDYYRVSQKILGLKHDLFLSKQMPLSHKTFIANRDISIFCRIDALIDESIVVGGEADSAIPLEEFNDLLANFPTTTELDHYARARVTNVLKDYLGTMSDAQSKLDGYLNQKKTIRKRSKIEFIKDYEPKKFEYVRDEILFMLDEVEVDPKAYKEKDWQRQIAEFLLLIFPKYVAVLENVHIKDFYPKGVKNHTSRYIDFLLVDANGTVDIIEIKRPEPHQLLSRKPGSRGNYTPAGALSEAVMQVEKYLFHLRKGGQAGEHAIQKKRKGELPSGFEIRITNPKAMLILGRDKDFTSDQTFDFEIIKRKYANIVDIMTYDDLLRRLNNIIAMIGKNYSKLGSLPKYATGVVR